MAEVLSQSEIDALLTNIASGDSTAKPIVAEREIVPFDFRLPNRISKNQLRTIRNIHENFAESFSSFLMGKLQTIININVVSVDQIYYSEYVLSVSNPACLFTFDIKGTDIKGILELSPTLALSFVDRLLGGNGLGSKSSKTITPIEQKVLFSLVQRILQQDLRKAWQIIEDFEFGIDRFEPDIDFAQITSQSESVLLVSFEIFIGEQSYLMNLCFATYAFDTILSKLSSQSLSTIRPVKYKGTTSRTILLDHLQKTKLNVSVEFGRAKISFQQLLELGIDDILILENKVGEELRVRIDNKDVFNGVAGTVNNRKAVKITRKIENKE